MDPLFVNLGGRIVVFAIIHVYILSLYLLPGVIISDVIIVIRAMRLSAYGPFVSSALRSRFFCSSLSQIIVYCACITILSLSLNNICSVC